MIKEEFRKIIQETLDKHPQKHKEYILWIQYEPQMPEIIGKSKDRNKLIFFGVEKYIEETKNKVEILYTFINDNDNAIIQELGFNGGDESFYIIEPIKDLDNE